MNDKKKQTNDKTYTNEEWLKKALEKIAREDNKKSLQELKEEFLKANGQYENPENKHKK